MTAAAAGGSVKIRNTAAAENLEFERAAALRDRIQAISVLGKTQQVIAGVCADTDVWGIYTGQVRCGCSVLHIEDGNLLGREVEVFPAAAEEDESAVLLAVLSQYYLGRAVLPAEICLPVLPGIMLVWKTAFAGCRRVNSSRLVL